MTATERIKAILEREDRIFYLTLAGLIVALAGALYFMATAPSWKEQFDVFKQCMVNISLPILIPYITKKTLEGVAGRWPQKQDKER